MADEDPRATLEALIRERGEDYASLSRLIGRNAAYIQQFIKRGVPRKLDEADRRTLARYFGIAEARLGGAADEAGVVRDVRPTPAPAMVMVPRLDVGASAGYGAFAGAERAQSHIGFDPAWLRDVAEGAPGQLSIIRVQGDSMAPTLIDGDDILVDSGDAADRLRDGIYVLRVEEALIVKRVALQPSGRRLRICSDNPHYPDWSDYDPETLAVVGRVIWAGRRLA